MNKAAHTLTVKDHPDLKMKMLNWANRFNIFCLADNNGYDFEDPAFECLLGAGVVRSFSFPAENALIEFQGFYDESPSWLFGHLSYNALGNAYSKEAIADVEFGRGFFFEPEIVIRLAGGILEIVKSNISFEDIAEQIISSPAFAIPATERKLNIQPHISREEYIRRIEKIKQHIQRGDCYEINFCQQFSATDAALSPLHLYEKLMAASPAPFAAFYKLNDLYCLCASPERFLKKTGAQLISQPIKGTARRDRDNAAADELQKRSLLQSAKERAENVMIVDLVRNDMSKVAEKDSVKVSELFGVYSFPKVHHLISTIEGKLATGKKFTQAIESCFPMGSMTGAPKKRVMELIEEFESSDRGLFSGSAGYITPDGDFDLNVVIRSIFYDSNAKKISFAAGGGITFYSDAEAEYDESMAKAEAILEILGE